MSTVITAKAARESLPMLHARTVLIDRRVCEATHRIRAVNWNAIAEEAFRRELKRLEEKGGDL